MAATTNSASIKVSDDWLTLIIHDFAGKKRKGALKD
jgi:hypothetical protein